MKTSKIILFAVIFSLFLMSSIALSQDNSSTLYVDDDGTQDYASIQDAIENASDGDTVFVYNGIYEEGSFLINKSINLIGENKENTIIQGSSTQDQSYIVNIISDDVALSGFTIRNSTLLEILPSIPEDDNPIDIKINVGDGVRISSDNITIFGNIIKDNGGDGIVLYSGQNTTIVANILSNNSQAIYLKYCSSNLVVNNSIEDNKLGIVFLNDSYDNIFYHNNFINSSLYHASDNGKNIFYSEELKQGNYWDEYKGTDKNNDGIGDTAYNVSSTTQDKYPLMNPYIGRIVIKDFYVDEFSVQLMLVVGMIATIIFCVPIGLWWRKKYFK